MIGVVQIIEMVPINRSYTTSYLSVIESINLSCTVFYLFYVQNIVYQNIIQKLQCGFLFASRSNYDAMLYRLR